MSNCRDGSIGDLCLVEAAVVIMGRLKLGGAMRRLCFCHHLARDGEPPF